MPYKLILQFFSVVAMSVFLSGCTIPYMLESSVGHLQLMMQRKPIESVIKTGKLSEAEKEKLRLVLDVKKFARDRISLNVGGSYSDFVQLDRNAVSWNVIASHSLQLEPVTWWFPVAGRVPYLGFYNLEDARKKADELEALGYDVRISEVAGYSTLGWFDDPIFSSQLKFHPVQLAGIVIHELTHATLWIGNDVAFNESLATFVEEKGLYQYYLEKKDKSMFLKDIERIRKREKSIVKLYLAYETKLRALYRENIDDKSKYSRKNDLLNEFRVKLLDLYDGSNKDKVDSIRRKNYNNADFISVSLYETGTEKFEKIYRESDSWSDFFNRIKNQ